jgi:hypothetical protein
MILLLTVLGFVLSFISTGIYVADILRGRTKPHLYTYVVWSIVTLIAFFGSLVSGGGYGAWIIGVTGLLTVVIVPLSVKYGTKDIKIIDAVFLCGALISIVPWLILKDPLWSVVLAVIIDICGYLPTMRKTWSAPESEILSPWAMGGVKSALAIVTLDAFSVTTVLFPAEIVVMNGILSYIIISRRGLGKGPG